MSRLHRQKLRLRARQRGDGVIDADCDVVDAKHFQKQGTGRQRPRKVETSKTPADGKGGSDAQKLPQQDDTAKPPT